MVKVYNENKEVKNLTAEALTATNLTAEALTVESINNLSDQNLANLSYSSRSQYKEGAQEELDRICAEESAQALASNSGPGHFPTVVGIGNINNNGEELVSYAGSTDYATVPRIWSNENRSIQHIGSSSKCVVNCALAYLHDQELLDLTENVLNAIGKMPNSKLYPHFFEEDGTQKPLYQVDLSEGKDPVFIFEGDNDLSEEEKANYDRELDVPDAIASNLDYYVYDYDFGFGIAKKLLKIYYNKKEITNTLSIANFIAYTSGVYDWGWGDVLRKDAFGGEGAGRDYVGRDSTGAETYRYLWYYGIGLGNGFGGPSMNGEGYPSYITWYGATHLITYIENRQVCIDAGFYSDQLRRNEDGTYNMEDVEALNLVDGNGGFAVVDSNSYECVLKAIGARLLSFNPGTKRNYDSHHHLSCFAEYAINAAAGNDGDYDTVINWKYLTNETNEFYNKVGAIDTYGVMPDLTKANEIAKRYRLSQTVNVDENGNYTWPNAIAHESNGLRHGGLDWENVYGMSGEIPVATTVAEHKLYELVNWSVGFVATDQRILPGGTWLMSTTVNDMAKLMQFINTGQAADGTQLIRPLTLSGLKSLQFGAAAFDYTDPNNYSTENLGDGPLGVYEGGNHTSNGANMHNAFGTLQASDGIWPITVRSQPINGGYSGIWGNPYWGSSYKYRCSWGGYNGTEWSVNMNTGRYYLKWVDTVAQAGGSAYRPGQLNSKIDRGLVPYTNYGDKDVYDSYSHEFGSLKLLKEFIDKVVKQELSERELV